jgi:hypothetical protein
LALRRPPFGRLGFRIVGILYDADTFNPARSKDALGHLNALMMFVP